MTERISTRRAIEVCLSRIPMQDGTRRDLVYALQKAIREEGDQAPHDPARLLAAAHLAIDALSGVDTSFDKASMIGRIREAKRHLIEGIKAAKPRDQGFEKEPSCDISGLCEPHPEDQDKPEAMCAYCGGWRYKDSPRPGNWGTEPPQETGAL